MVTEEICLEEPNLRYSDTLQDYVVERLNRALDGIRASAEKVGELEPGLFEHFVFLWSREAPLAWNAHAHAEIAGDYDMRLVAEVLNA